MDEPIRLLHVGDSRVPPGVADRGSGQFVVDTVTEPSMGLDRLEGGEYDCVLSAYELSGMTGLDFFRRVRETDPVVPFILCPENGSEKIASDAITAGVTDYVHRPAALADRIEAAVDRETHPDRQQGAFEALHDIATTIHHEQTVEAVCERIVAAATDILDFDTCAVLIREDDQLVPYAISENTPPGGVRRMGIEEGVAGKTFQTGEPVITENIPETEQADPAKESYRSAISVPIGEYGVFQAVSIELVAFDDEDVDFAELLVSHAASRIEQIEREKALRRQNERLDEFAGIVSHDLSNPLNVAQLQLTLARESVDNDRLAAVARAHDRMETLIDTLLTLARSGEPVEETTPVDLAATAESCLETLDTDRIELTVDSPVRIRADSDLVRVLLENILKNSAEHSSPDEAGESSPAVGDGRAEHTVTVRIGSLDGDGFFLEDDGPGIPEEIRTDIFESGVSTSADGTGFGLKIVSEIVDAHGWQIRGTEGDDGGARFEITGVNFAR